MALFVRNLVIAVAFFLNTTRGALRVAAHIGFSVPRNSMLVAVPSRVA